MINASKNNVLVESELFVIASENLDVEILEELEVPDPDEEEEEECGKEKEEC